MHYDPLTAPSPGEGLPHVPSYWAATAGPSPGDDGPLWASVETDVAIIGGGYTGLSCAAYLARDYGLRPVVLEANRPMWGCSGRNGSFVGPMLGRVPFTQWTKRWGKGGARALWAEANEAVQTVRSLIRTGAIDCDVQPDGRMRLAHTNRKVRSLAADCEALRCFGADAEMLSGDEIARDHFFGREAFGALRLTNGFAVHPLKLGFGIASMARTAGAIVHSASPVLTWEKRGATHLLRTPNGEVRAKNVVFATNGYTNERLHPALAGGLLPLISNIVVTRPMTANERAACNLVSTDCLSDTRKFLSYFRRLPDDRIMLGNRGPLTEGGAEVHEQWLLSRVRDKFPALADITVDYFWGGWVALTHDAMPHVTCANDDPTVLYALGYCGSGVAAANHAGRRLAERLGENKTVLPQIASSLPRFPLAQFRRLGQALAFQWYHLRDATDF